MADSVIIQPPRTFQYVVVLHFTDDARSDQEIQQHILDRISYPVSIGNNIKAIGCARVATMPPGAQ